MFDDMEHQNSGTSLCEARLWCRRQPAAHAEEPLVVFRRVRSTDEELDALCGGDTHGGLVGVWCTHAWSAVSRCLGTCPRQGRALGKLVMNSAHLSILHVCRDTQGWPRVAPKSAARHFADELPHTQLGEFKWELYPTVVVVDFLKFSSVQAWHACGFGRRSDSAQCCFLSCNSDFGYP